MTTSHGPTAALRMRIADPWKLFVMRATVVALEPTEALVIPGKTSRFAIPRHQFEPEWPLSWIFFFVKGNFEKEPPGYAIF